MSKFRKIRHVVPAFPIREHPSALIDDNDRLEIVANQYIPLNNQTPSDGDVTILLCHANGFVKELYEPFLDELLIRCGARAVKIRSIWAPDIHCQGESGVLNERKLGGEVSWFDHTRDLFSLIVHNAEHFVRPVVGIGHSMGGAQLFRLSIMHPTLFTSLVGIDPVITTNSPFPVQHNPAIPSSRRRDVWPSLKAAEEFVRSRPFYRAWDPRVVNLLVNHGFRKLPTALYPDNPHNIKVYGTAGDEPVTLTTTKYQEVFTFLRSRTMTRDDPTQMFELLPQVEPPVLYVQGEHSTVNYGDSNEQKMRQTKPPVEMIVVKDAGHLVPMEKPNECADHIAPFIYSTVKKWGKEREEMRKSCPPSMTFTNEFLEKLDAMEKGLKAKM